MATLSVLKFDYPYGAERVMIALGEGMTGQVGEDDHAGGCGGGQLAPGQQENRIPASYTAPRVPVDPGRFLGLPVRVDFFVPFLGAAMRRSEWAV